jgi:hypothetical protein
MKVVTLAAVAAVFAGPAFAADLSMPPPAGDPIYAPAPMALVGHLELGVGFGKSDLDSDGVGLFEGAGRVNIPLHNDWNIQVDLNAAATFESGGYSYASAGPAAHVWHRGPAGAVGVFGGAGFGGGGTLGYVGAEATIDPTANTTLGLQASYGFGSYGYNYWNVRGWANYYFNPDTKLRGDVGYTSTNEGGSVWNVAAELEHRFDARPVSIFGRVGYASATYNGSSSSSWIGMGGIRLFLDPQGTTLQGHDHLVPWDVQYVQAAAPR